jgi:ubiquinone/menaquinone biosynthesis C-methylase UbiE
VIASSKRTVPVALRDTVRSLKRGFRRLGWQFVDRRLEREQRRGVLGPAHRRWRDNSAADNRERWAHWDWSNGGEEWNASAEWKQALVDYVLMAWIPQDRVVLEIGPGAGRWSAVLQPRARRLILVDVTDRPLALCRERFAAADNVEYVLSSGSDLPGIADSSIDAIWSFDVFVHVEPVDQAAYLAEVARVLAPGGVAIIHHADGRNLGDLPSRNGWRSPMSRNLFATLAAERGLRVETQIDSWGPGECYDLSAYHDAITVCRKHSAASKGLDAWAAGTQGPGEGRARADRTS